MSKEVELIMAEATIEIISDMGGIFENNTPFFRKELTLAWAIVMTDKALNN